jgi:PAS domain S-box-containing protein
VPDAADDPRIRDNPVVTRHGLRAYAGVALRQHDGNVIGTLCVADTRPRRWAKNDIHMLTSVAVAAASQAEISVISQRHYEAAQRYRTLLDSLPETLILVFDRELRLQVASGAALVRNGYQPDALIGARLDEIVPPDRADYVRPHYERGLAGIRHEFVNEAQDGVTYAIEVVPLPGPNGEIDAVMAVGRELGATSAARRAA